MADQDVSNRCPLRLDEFGDGAGRIVDRTGKTVADIHGGDMWFLESLIESINKAMSGDK